MKKIALLFFVFCSLIGYSQKDSTKPLPTSQITGAKKDTVYVGLFERRDTISALLLYGSPDGSVKYTQGAYIRKGFSVDKSSPKWNWQGNPEIIGYLDKNKKPLNNVLVHF